MKNIADIQLYLLNEWNIKTSARKLTGSMKGYTNISSRREKDGTWKKFPKEAQDKIQQYFPNANGKIYSFIGYENISIFQN